MTPTRPRSLTLPPKRLTIEERRAGQRLAARLAAHPEEDNFLFQLRADRPVTRGDCAGGERPCPWVSCAHHIYLDVNDETGSVKLNHPHLQPWDLAETCALDVADRAGTTLEETGALLNLTRERIRQVEVSALLKLRQRGEIELPDPLKEE
jgi:hypothetical protein